MVRPVFGSAANACLGQEERCVRRGKVRSHGEETGVRLCVQSGGGTGLECCAEADWFRRHLPPSLAALGKSPPLDQDACNSVSPHQPWRAGIQALLSLLMFSSASYEVPG